MTTTLGAARRSSVGTLEPCSSARVSGGCAAPGARPVAVGAAAAPALARCDGSELGSTVAPVMVCPAFVLHAGGRVAAVCAAFVLHAGRRLAAVPWGWPHPQPPHSAGGSARGRPARRRERDRLR